MTHKQPIYGLIAEFDNPHALVEAARRVREEGYQHYEAYSPFPVEELDEAMALRGRKVQILCLCGGIVGALTGFFMCWYAYVISYPLNIGGRPHNSWPAWIPLTFELMVLFAGLSAGIGMLLLNGFPRPHHPVFNAPGFELASQTRFFLCIESADAKFDRAQSESLLRGLKPMAVQEVPW